MIQSTEEAPQKGPSARSPECSQLPHIQRPVTLSRRHAALPRPQAKYTFKRNNTRLNEFYKETLSSMQTYPKARKRCFIEQKCPTLAFISEKNRMDQHFKQKHYYTIK
jgi:hypothetical protein